MIQIISLLAIAGTAFLIYRGNQMNQLWNICGCAGLGAIIGSSFGVAGSGGAVNAIFIFGFIGALIGYILVQPKQSNSQDDD
jgi:hypothetical protein